VYRVRERIAVRQSESTPGPTAPSAPGSTGGESHAGAIAAAAAVAAPSPIPPPIFNPLARGLSRDGPRWHSGGGRGAAGADAKSASLAGGSAGVSGSGGGGGDEEMWDHSAFARESRPAPQPVFIAVPFIVPPAASHVAAPHGPSPIAALVQQPAQRPVRAPRALYTPPAARRGDERAPATPPL
jgi:hypothetical protein